MSSKRKTPLKVMEEIEEAPPTEKCEIKLPFKKRILDKNGKENEITSRSSRSPRKHSLGQIKTTPQKVSLSPSEYKKENRREDSPKNSRSPSIRTNLKHNEDSVDDSVSAKKRGRLEIATRNSDCDNSESEKADLITNNAKADEAQNAARKLPKPADATCGLSLSTKTGQNKVAVLNSDFGRLGRELKKRGVRVLSGSSEQSNLPNLEVWKKKLNNALHNNDQREAQQKFTDKRNSYETNDAELDPDHESIRLELQKRGVRADRRIEKISQNNQNSLAKNKLNELSQGGASQIENVAGQKLEATSKPPVVSKSSKISNYGSDFESMKRILKKRGVQALIGDELIKSSKQKKHKESSSKRSNEVPDEVSEQANSVKSTSKVPSNNIEKDDASSDSDFDYVFREFKKRGIRTDRKSREEIDVVQQNSHTDKKSKEAVSEEIQNIARKQLFVELKDIKKNVKESTPNKISAPLSIRTPSKVRSSKRLSVSSPATPRRSISPSPTRSMRKRTLLPENDDESPAKRKKGSEDRKNDFVLVFDNGKVKRRKYQNENYAEKKSCITPLKRMNGEVNINEMTTPESKIMKKCETPRTPLEEARVCLHVSAVPKVLSCRETEFQMVHSFVKNKILDEIGGCMYISGVPGTGKTATVTSAMTSLIEESKRKEIPSFNYVELNGMRLSDPRQAYVLLWRGISKKKERISAEQAMRKLENWFSKTDDKKISTVVLVDELDLMCTRKQDVVYNLLDWPSKSGSRLVVLTIANTLDMPERKLKGRVNSRLGLTRITFLPYTHQQLEKIVLDRLNGSDAFVPDAVRLVSRKVAAVSGDARRALDICRRATELPAPDQAVRVLHIEQAIKEMTNSNTIRLIRSCSRVEKLFLRSVVDTCLRSGLEEVEFLKVLDHLLSVCGLECIERPSVSVVLGICYRLICFRLLFSNDHSAGILQRLTLNVTQDDIHYALKVDG